MEVKITAPARDIAELLVAIRDGSLIGFPASGLAFPEELTITSNDNQPTKAQDQLDALRKAFPRLSCMTTSELIAELAARDGVKKQDVTSGDTWSIHDGVDSIEIKGRATILVIKR